MTDTERLRVALVDHTRGQYALGLAASLPQVGVQALLIAPQPVALLETVLGKRGFATPLTHIPAATATLVRGNFDVVHAFSPPDALAALAWRRRTGGLVIFTCTDTLGRHNLADRRLRLHAVSRAVEDSDALIAANEEVRAALDRWMAADADVMGPGDGAAHLRLYSDLLAQRRAG